jgi:hypothetical protein
VILVVPPVLYPGIPTLGPSILAPACRSSWTSTAAGPDSSLGPERWTPHSSLGSMLASARGAERFVLWRRFVRTAGLPNLIYTFQGRHQTESLLATDSALAAELLGREFLGARASVRMQEVFPAPEDFAVRDQWPSLRDGVGSPVAC